MLGREYLANPSECTPFEECALGVVQSGSLRSCRAQCILAHRTNTLAVKDTLFLTDASIDWRSPCSDNLVLIPGKASCSVLSCWVRWNLLRSSCPTAVSRTRCLYPPGQHAKGTCSISIKPIVVGSAPLRSHCCWAAIVNRWSSCWSLVEAAQ